MVEICLPLPLIGAGEQHVSSSPAAILVADDLVGAGAIRLAAFGYACGPMIYQRQFGGLDVRATMGAALACAARMAIITYVAPVVALACGVVFPDEPVGLGTVVGLVLILTGSWLSTDGRVPRGRRRRHPAASPP